MSLEVSYLRMNVDAFAFALFRDRLRLDCDSFESGKLLGQVLVHLLVDAHLDLSIRRHALLERLEAVRARHLQLQVLLASSHV